MKLTEILRPECVRAPLKAREKYEAITELVDVLAEAGRIYDREVVLRAVLDRERTASTGVGMGLAVPHGKCGGCSDLVMSVGKPAEPIDFESKDRDPVQIIVLLASPPDKTGPHIQALARVSRLMMTDSFRERLPAVQSADELFELIREHDH